MISSHPCLQTHQAELNELRSELSSANNATLKQETDKLASLFETERQQLQESLEEQLREKITAQDTLAKAVAEKEHEILQMRLSLDTARAESIQLDEQRSRQIDELNVALASAASSEQLKEISARYSQSQAECKALMESTAMLEAQRDAARNENATLLMAVKKLEDAASARQSTESDAVQRLQSQIQVLEQNAEQLKSQRDDAMASAAVLQREIASVQQESAANAQQHMAELQAATTDIGTLRTELSQLHSAAQEFTETENSLREQLSDMTAERAEAKSMASSLAGQLREAVAAEETTRSRLQTDLSSLLEEKEKLAARVISCQSENKQLSVLHSEAQERLVQGRIAQGQLERALQEQKQMLEDVSAGLGADADDDERARLQEELSASNEDNDDLRQQIAASKEASQELQRVYSNQLLELEKHKERLEQDLASSRKEVEEESADKQKLADKLIVLTKSLDERTSSANTWEGKFNNSMVLISERETAMEELRLECENQRNIAAALTQQEITLSESLRNLRQEMTTVASENASLNAQLASEKQSAEESLSSLTDSHHTEIRQLTQQLTQQHSAQLQEEMARKKLELNDLEERMRSDASEMTAVLTEKHLADCQRLQSQISSEQEARHVEQEQSELLSQQVKSLQARAQATHEVLSSCVRALHLNSTEEQATLENEDSLPSHIEQVVLRSRDMHTDLATILGVEANLTKDSVDNPDLFMQAVRDRLQILEDTHRNAEQRLQLDLERTVQESQALLRAAEAEHRSTILRVEEQRSELEIRLSDEQGVVSIMQEREISEVERARQRSEAKLQAVLADHQREVENLVGQHADEIKQLSDAHSETLNQLRDQHDNAMVSLKTSLEADSEAEAAAGRQEQSHLKQMLESAVTEKTALQSKIELLLQQLEEREEMLKQEHLQALRALQSRFEEQSKSMQSELRTEQATAVAAVSQDLVQRHALIVDELNQNISTLQQEKELLEQNIHEREEHFMEQLRTSLEKSANELESVKNELATAMSEKEELYREEIEALRHDLDAKLDSHDATFALDSQKALLEAEKDLAVQQLRSELESVRDVQVCQLQEQHSIELDKVVSLLKSEQSRLQQTLAELSKVQDAFRSSTEAAALKESELNSLRVAVEEVTQRYEREVSAVREESRSVLALHSSAREQELKEQYDAAVEDLQLRLTAKNKLEISAVESGYEEKLKAVVDEHQRHAAEELLQHEQGLMQRVLECIDAVRLGTTDSNVGRKWPGLTEKLVLWKANANAELTQSLVQHGEDVASLVERLSEDAEWSPAIEGSPPYVQKLLDWRTRVNADCQQLVTLATNVAILEKQISDNEDQLKAALERQQAALVAKYVATFEETTQELEKANQEKLQREIEEQRQTWDQEMQLALEDQQERHNAELQAGVEEKALLVSQQMEQQHQQQLAQALADREKWYEKELRATESGLKEALVAQEKHFQALLLSKQSDLDQCFALCDEHLQNLEKVKVDLQRKLAEDLAEQEASHQRLHNQVLEDLRTQLLEENKQSVAVAVQQAQAQTAKPLEEKLAALQSAKTLGDEQLAHVRNQLQEAQATHQKFVGTHLATAIAEAEKWQNTCKTALIEREEARARVKAVQQTCNQQAGHIAGLERQTASLQSQLRSLQEAEEGREGRRNSELEEVSNLLRLVEDDKVRLEDANSTLTSANQKLLAVLSSLARSLGKSSDAVAQYRQRLPGLSAAREPPEGQQQQTVHRSLPSTSPAVSAHQSSPSFATVTLAESFVPGSVSTSGSHYYTQSSPLMSSTMVNYAHAPHTSSGSTSVSSSQSAVRSLSTTADSGLGVVGVATASSTESVGQHVVYTPRRQQHSLSSESDSDVETPLAHSARQDQSVLPLSFSNLPPSQLNFSFELGDAGPDGDVASVLVNAVQNLWTPRRDTGSDVNGHSPDLSQDFNESIFEGPALDEDAEALLCRVANDLVGSLQQLFLQHGERLTNYQETTSQQDVKIKHLVAGCTELQTRLEGATQELERMRSECNRVVAELEARQTSKVASLAEELSGAQQRLAGLSAENKSLSDERDTLQREDLELRQSCQAMQREQEVMAQQFSTDRNKLNSDIESLQQRLQRSEEEKSEVQRRVTEMAQEVATASLLRERLMAVSAENDDLRQQLDEHLEQVKSHELAVSKIHELQVVYASAQRDQQQLQKQLSERDQEVTMLTQRVDALASSSRHVAVQVDGGQGMQQENLILMPPRDFGGGDDNSSQSGSLSNVSELSLESTRQFLLAEDTVSEPDWLAAVINVINEWAGEQGLHAAADVAKSGSDAVQCLSRLRATVSRKTIDLEDESAQLAAELTCLRTELEKRSTELEADAARLTQCLAVSQVKIEQLEQLLAVKQEEAALAEERLETASNRNESNLRAVEEMLTQKQAAEVESLKQDIRHQYQEQLNSSLADIQNQHQTQLQTIRDGYTAIVDQLVQRHSLEVGKLTQCLQSAGTDTQEDAGDADAVSSLLMNCLDAEHPQDTAELSASSSVTALGLAVDVRANSQSVLDLIKSLSGLNLGDSTELDQLRLERDSLQATASTLQQLVANTRPDPDGDSLRNDIVEALQRMFAQQRDLLSAHTGMSASNVLAQQQKIWDAERALLHSEIQQLQRSLETLRQESQQYAADLHARLAARDDASSNAAAMEQLRQQLHNALQQVVQLKSSLVDERRISADLQKGLEVERSELESSRAQLLELTEQLNSAQCLSSQATLKLQVEQQRVADLHRSLDALQAEANRHAGIRDAEDSHFKAALNEQAQRLEKLRSEHSDREAALEGEVRRLEDMVDRLTRQTDLAVQSERERGQQLLAQASAGAQELRRLLEEERRISLSASRKGDADRDQGLRASEQLQAAEQQHRELRSELQREQVAALDASSKILQLEEQVAKLSNSIAEHQLTLTQLRGALAEKAALCRDLESRLSEMEQLRRRESEDGHERAQQQLRSALSAVQGQVSELTAQLDTERALVQELSRKEQLHSTTYGSLQHDKDRLESQLRVMRQQLNTANEALAARKSRTSVDGDEDGCFKCRVAVPRLQRQHDEMSQLAERLGQERSRIQDELNEVADKERRLRRDHQQLRISSQVVEQQRGAEHASWQKERSSLLKQLSAQHTTTSDPGLQQRFARAERFRRELSFQKQYLMTLLGGFADCEEAVLWHVKRQPARQHRLGDRPPAKASRFVIVARSIIAVCRMKRFVVAPPIPRSLPTGDVSRKSHRPHSVPLSASTSKRNRSHSKPRSGSQATHVTQAVEHPTRLMSDALDNISEAESSQSDAAFRVHVQRLNRLQDRLNSVSIPASSLQRSST